jgi:transglutaminase-like putative cysteine protease
MTTSSRHLGCAGPSPTSPFSFHSFKLSKGGDNAIIATIRAMQALVYGRGGVKSPDVRVAALEAVKGVERGQAEIESVFNWVKEHIEFRGEHAETLQEPRVTLQLGAGDCDDHAMLVSALAASLGFRTRFRTVATPSSPEDFSHVFAEIEDKKTGQWIPVDSTVGSSYAGWAPPNATRSQDFRILGQQEQMSLQTVAVWIGIGLAADWLAKRVKF